MDDLGDAARGASGTRGRTHHLPRSDRGLRGPGVDAMGEWLGDPARRARGSPAGIVGRRRRRPSQARGLTPGRDARAPASRSHPALERIEGDSRGRRSPEKLARRLGVTSRSVSAGRRTYLRARAHVGDRDLLAAGRRPGHADRGPSARLASDGPGRVEVRTGSAGSRRSSGGEPRAERRRPRPHHGRVRRLFGIVNLGPGERRRLDPAPTREGRPIMLSAAEKPSRARSGCSRTERQR